MSEPTDPTPSPAASRQGPDGWLVQAADGDLEAFAQVYDALVPRIHGLVRRVVVDPSLSEEVTQEVFVEAWRTAPRYDPLQGSAAAWVGTIAHRRAVDRVRSEAASRARVESVSRQVDPAHGHDVVGEEVADEAAQRQVRDALAVLTALEREAIELAYYRGYTYREVAEHLGAPLGTVKARLRAGLARLRSVLGDEP